APWRDARGVLAALAVLSAVVAQTFTSFETALSKVEGWHSTLAPLTSMASGALSGCAVLALIKRSASDKLNKLALGPALLLTCCAVLDRFTAWYQGQGLL